MDRIVLLGTNDLLLGIQMKRMEELLISYDENETMYDVNDLIELFVVTKYINKNIYPMMWSSETLMHNQMLAKKIKETIGQYLGKINNNNFLQFYHELESGMLRFHYERYFWMIFNEYKMCERIDKSIIKEVLSEKHISIKDFLIGKNIVAEYGDVLREKLLSSPEYAELLLDEFVTEHDDKWVKYCFPKELTMEDRVTMIKNYIEYEDVHPNYLERIIMIRNDNNNLCVDDRIKLAAQRKFDLEQEKMFGHEKTTKRKVSVKVGFYKNQKDIRITDTGNSTKIDYRYSLDWVLSNQDYPTLLNNFISIFDYVDLQQRITLVTDERSLSLFEKWFGPNAKNTYKYGETWEIMDMIANYQISVYYQKLKAMDIMLENVIQWFFESYLKEEFFVEGFRMNAPSEGGTYLEKCRHILSEMDGVLKQYDYYVDDGFVDQALFQFASKPKKFKDCKSKINKKYVYGNSSDYKKMRNLLFSENSEFGYVERIEKTYNNFYELLKNEKVYVSDYKRYRKYLDWLVEQELIKIKDEEIHFGNLYKVAVLKDLWDNQVISYWHLNKRMRDEIDKMISCNDLIYKNELFSLPEQEYFDYHLNRATFVNGLDIRNRYAHGNQPTDEKTHYEDYMIILKLFVLIVIKINDEMILVDRFFNDKN